MTNGYCWELKILQPNWDDGDFNAGTMVRGGLWLVQVIGEGNIFTKDDVRKAFPTIAQADRRIRDLRDYEWKILTNTEDASLSNNEQRFVAAGIPVWESGARRAATPSRINSKQRAAALKAANYQCLYCGVSAGELYPEDSQLTAVLVVTSNTTQNAVVICRRCHAGRPQNANFSGPDVLRELNQMNATELRQFGSWVQRGKRGVTRLDRAWRGFLNLNEDERATVLNQFHKISNG